MSVGRAVDGEVHLGPQHGLHEPLLHELPAVPHTVALPAGADVFHSVRLSPHLGEVSSSTGGVVVTMTVTGRHL